MGGGLPGIGLLKRGRRRQVFYLKEGEMRGFVDCAHAPEQVCSRYVPRHLAVTQTELHVGRGEQRRSQTPRDRRNVFVFPPVISSHASEYCE